MLWSSGDGSRALLADLFFDLVGGAACVDVLGLRGLGYNPAFVGVGADEFAFAAVPFGKDLG